jgi:urease accessory protein
MFDGPDSGWHAALALHFAPAHGHTGCRHRHCGPLRMQKALYPEGPAVCHAVLLHPPGGIAGGDTLAISLDVASGAHALVTTPGAAKWYKANGRSAEQHVRLSVAGTLEWLPQEAIVFDAARVRSSVDIELQGEATMIGWDITALGRRAMGERFGQGRYAQSIRLHHDGALLWHERTRLAGGDALLDSPIGLAGHHVFGCLWAAGPGVAALDLGALRAQLAEQADAAPLTRLAPRLLVARTLAHSTLGARRALEAVWQALRPLLTGLPAHAPRLWAT